MDNLKEDRATVELELALDKLLHDSISLSRKEVLLPDGRPLKSELWGQFGYTFLTYTFPKDNLETETTDDIVAYLSQQGIPIDRQKFPPKTIDLMTSTTDSSLYTLTLTLTEPDD